MTGADTPSITVRQYGDAASIRSLILSQPDNTEFLLCWKGKYIVGITHVPAESHFNVRYEYDNNAVIAHDFFANDPYPGVLTIDASESSDPNPVADFETELRAFLQTVGVSNVALSRVAQLEWWNTNAAFYEVPIPTVTVEDEDGQTVVLVGRGPDFENGDGDLLISFRSNQDKNYLVYMGEELNYMTVNGGMTDVGPVSEDYESVIPIINCSNGSAETPADNYKLIFWAKDNNLWSVATVHGIDIYDTNDPGVVGQIDSVQVISGKKVISCFQDDYFILQEDEWLADTGELLLDGNGAFTIPFESGQFTDVYGCNSVNSSNLEDRMKCYNGMMFYLAGVITQTPTGFPI